MGNPEYVKLILFHLESKLLFPYLEAPEMGTQAQFILLMEIIKQYDYLEKKPQLDLLIQGNCFLYPIKTVIV